MKIEKLTLESYKKWNDFCSESRDAWFWHTTDYIDYLINYRPERKPQNESFFIIGDDNKPVGICPLLLEEGESGEKLFTYGGDYNPNPGLLSRLSLKEKEKILDFTFKYLDELAKDLDVKYYRLRMAALTDSSITDKQYYNYLINYGFIISNVNTTIIDLSEDAEKIYNSFRHGHKENIRRYKDKLSAKTFAENTSWEEFNKYKEMHHLASGRVTRPEKTFRIMHEWLKASLAFMVGIKRGEDYAGFFLFSVFNNKAFYSSSATDPALISLPIGHIAIWEAIKHMKKVNIGFFEIGWQEYGDTLFKKVSEKEKNLSYFKSGFGGFSKTIFQGIKFYDQSFREKILNDKYA